MKRLRGSREGVWDRFEKLEETTIAWRSHIDAEVQNLNQQLIGLNQKMADLARKTSEGNMEIEKARADLAKAIREEQRGE